MTEAEWLAGNTPGPMIELLREQLRPRWIHRLLRPSDEDSTHRKLWRFVGHVLLCHYPYKCTATDHQNILDSIDHWANGEPVQYEGETRTFFSLMGECFGQNFDIWSSPWTKATRAAWWAVDPNDPLNGLRECALIRCLFGNPFRPVVFSPSWRSSTAVTLASQMYESRDFSAMPVLADALQDAGCNSAEVLDHCRGPEPHVRGCWVVDLVLGKE